jgi:hypothetical protein
MDDVVVDHDVVVHDRVVVRMPAGRQRQESRRQNRRRGRHAEPLNRHVFPSDFSQLSGDSQPASRNSG